MGVQELVETGDDDGHDHSEEPDTNCGTRHIGIISVRHCRTDFWVWRVVLEVTKIDAVQIGVIEVGISRPFNEIWGTSFTGGG